MIATSGIAEALRELKKGDNPGFHKHLKTGTQALPSAVQDAMAQSAEREIEELGEATTIYEIKPDVNHD